MKLIEDGNLTATVRGALIVIGAILIFGGLGVEAIPNWLGIIVFLFGIVAIFVGGISSRAKMIGLKPFGKSEWRKAKETYQKEKDDK
ncbi:DUF4231 domain-containing protein [Cupriavidus laharis]|uniref:DUF4231 domain-containing protein n=1 Tax=Cupriavidus laharis TaxID=151654 RepID=UPI001CC6DD03|nr:DUF4231 domain-containing protein [Cupriavidus laharis]